MRSKQVAPNISLRERGSGGLGGNAPCIFMLQRPDKIGRYGSLNWKEHNRQKCTVSINIPLDFAGIPVSKV